MLPNVYIGTANTSEYFVSEKYDGIRAYWNGERLLTRSGKIIHAPAWFVKDWPRIPLDGELWVGRGQFEATTSIVLDAQPDDESWRKVRYMVFDLPARSGSFADGLQSLSQILASASASWLHPVEQLKVRDEEALQAKLHEVVALGGEGLVLHRASSLYRAERNDDLLKLKPIEDAEARVIAYVSGAGKYAGLVGALEVERSDGLRFRIGTGMSDDQRRNPPNIGAWVTYTYQGFTARGVPRFARFLRIRPDDL